MKMRAQQMKNIFAENEFTHAIVQLWLCPIRFVRVFRFFQLVNCIKFKGMRVKLAETL